MTTPIGDCRRSGDADGAFTVITVLQLNLPGMDPELVGQHEQNFDCG